MVAEPWVRNVVSPGTRVVANEVLLQFKDLMRKPTDIFVIAGWVVHVQIS